MKIPSALVASAVSVLFGFSVVSLRGQAAGPPTQVFKPGPGIVAPVPVLSVEPKYTLDALHAKIQGQVVMQLVVHADGTVGEITVTKSLDQQYGLDQEAVRAAKQWLFKPGTKDGKPVDVLITLDMTFVCFGCKDSPTSANSPTTNQTPPTNARSLLTGQDSQDAVAVPMVGPVTDEEFTRGTCPEWTPGLAKPKALSQPAPEYTSEAMQAKIEGDVLIDAVVDTDGTVIRARVMRPLDTKYGLDKAALDAVKTWTFEPGSLKGQPVPVIVRLTVSFKLH